MTTVMQSENPIMLIIPDRDNLSPISSSSVREIRGIRLFRAISRRLTRRSSENFNFNRDTNSRSSSSDSCASSSITTTPTAKKEKNSSRDSGFRSVSPNHISSSSSDTGSDVQVRQRHHHSASAENVRRVFQNLSLNTRSSSCNNTKDTKRKTSKKSTPKRILRSPVTYTYVRGLSGLPTQRIPKSQARMYMNTCGCSIQYMTGLNR